MITGLFRIVQPKRVGVREFELCLAGRLRRCARAGPMPSVSLELRQSREPTTGSGHVRTKRPGSGLEARPGRSDCILGHISAVRAREKSKWICACEAGWPFLLGVDSSEWNMPSALFSLSDDESDGIDKPHLFLLANKSAYKSGHVEFCSAGLGGTDRMTVSRGAFVASR